jgi:streptogramin lyase
MRALAVAAVSIVAAAPHLPGAHATRICAAAGPYWPTMTLAIDGGTAWVACKEQARIIRVATADGRVVSSRALDGQPIAVRAGLGSVWVLDSGGTLYRLDPRSGKIVHRLTLPVTAAYNIWTGGGSLWVADDQGAAVVRVSADGRRVLARARTGDGPASMAFSGTTGWVLSHRDRVLTRIDLRTNRARQVAVVPGSAPERLAFAAGSLWMTGRGTDLLQVDPSSGRVRKTIEIGASGIDVVVRGGYLWVPTRSAEGPGGGPPPAPRSTRPGSRRWMP